MPNSGTHRFFTGSRIGSTAGYEPVQNANGNKQTLLTTMKTIPGAPQKTNAKIAGQLLSITKENSSSDDADFNLDTYSRNSSGTTRTATEKKSKTNDDNENEMKMISVMT
jgi:hypothetical protein